MRSPSSPAPESVTLLCCSELQLPSLAPHSGAHGSLSAPHADLWLLSCPATVMPVLVCAADIYKQHQLPNISRGQNLQ